MNLRFEAAAMRIGRVACAAVAIGIAGCRDAPAPPKPEAPKVPPPPAPAADVGPSLELGPQSQAYAEALAGYAEGIRARRTGEMDRALDLWHSAAGLDPGLTNLALGLAHEFLQRGETNRALINLERVRNELPDDPLIQLRLAADFRRMGRLEDSREAAMRVLAGEQPSHLAEAVLFDLDSRRDGVAVALDLLRIRGGDSAQKSGFWELVGQCYADILSEHDKLGVKEIAEKTLPLFEIGGTAADAGLPLRVKVARLRLAVGRPADAAALLEEMLRTHPEVGPVARQFLAIALAQLNQFDRLAPVLEQIVAENPDKGDLLVTLGDVYARLGRRGDMRRALKAAQGKGVPPTDLAAVCERHKDWEGAEYFLFEAVRGPLASPDPYIDLHRILSDRQKRHRDSLVVLKEAEKRFPTAIPVRLAAADAAADAREFDQALAILDEAERIAKFGEQEGSLPAVWFSRGIVHERAGRLGEAEIWLRKVIDAQPRHHPAMNYLSYTWADKNMKLDEALELVRRALGMEPENAAYLDTLGWIYFRMGRFEQALAEIDHALKIEPDEPEVLQHRGDALEKLGCIEEARAAWEKALALDPERAAAIGERLGRLPPRPAPAADAKGP